MRKILFFALAIALFSIACEDEINREKSPLPNPDADNVSFATDGKYIVGESATNFTVTLKRDVTDAELTVNIKVLKCDSISYFNIPTTATFAVGESETTIDIEFLKDLIFFESYTIQLAIDNEEQINPYNDQDTYPVSYLNLVREDFVPYAEGTYHSDFWWEESYPKLLEYSPATQVYRIKAAWDRDGYDLTFKMSGTNVNVIGVTRGSTKEIPTGYVHATYGMVYARFAGSTYDDATKTYTFRPISWMIYYPDGTSASFGNGTERYEITTLL